MSFNVLIIENNKGRFQSKNIKSEKFSVVIQLDNLNDWEKDKIYRAVDIWTKAFNLIKFKDFVVNFYWWNRVCTGRLWWKKCENIRVNRFQFNSGLSNQEIFEVIFGGKEVLGDGKIDHTAQVFLRIDRSNRRGVIGYTYPTTRWQWIYSWVINSFSDYEVAANLAHEYCHKCGFDDSSYSASRNAVTYQVGEFVENIKEQI